MPTLPNPGNINRVGLQPSTNIARGTGGTVEAARGNAALARGQQNVDLVNSVAGLGEHVVKLAQEHKRKLDGLVLDDAANRYRDATVELSVGEAGYRKAVGGDVLKPDYLKKNLEAYEARTKDISDGLNTPEQKEAFKVLAERGRSNFRMGLIEHSAEQSAAYDTTVFNSSIASNMNLAATSAGNARSVQEAVSATNAAVLKRAKDKGWDEATTQQAVLESTGAVHATVIDTLRQQGRIADANAYLAKQWVDAGVVPNPITGVPDPEIRNMTAAQLEAVQAKLKPATEWEQGAQAADVAMATYLTRDAKGNSDPKAEEKALKSIRKAGLTEGATHKAMAAFREQQAAHKQTEDNILGTAVEGFVAAGSTQEYANAFMKTDEFLGLPRETRGKWAKFFDDNAGLEDRRAVAAATKKWDELPAYQAFGFAAHGDLTKMPDTSIRALMPEIGPQRVEYLLRKKGEALTGAISFKLDSKLIQDTIPGPLLKDSNKEKRLAYLGIIEANLVDWQQNNPGRQPDQDTQTRLIRSALATYEKDPKGWFFTGETALYNAPAAEADARRKELNAKTGLTANEDPVEIQKYIDSARAKGLEGTEEWARSILRTKGPLKP